MQVTASGSDNHAGADDGFEDEISFSEHRFPPQGPRPFVTGQQYATNSAAPHHYLWPDNTLTSAGERPQQSSSDWKTTEIFAENRRQTGNSYLTEVIAGPSSSIWNDRLPIARNSYDQCSISESTAIQDITNGGASRDATGRTAFQCYREECHGKRFARHSELQRHEDRHNRPFICPVSACNKKDFADRGSLQRHSREVHKSAKYFCPISQCERHKRGFGRKYNLIGHNKRVHRGAASSSLLSPISENASAKSYMQDEGDRSYQSGNESGDGIGDDGGEDDDEPESPEDMASPRAPGKAEKLKQRLRKLRAAKNDHEVAGKQLSRDIETVERLLLDAICNDG